MHINWAPRLLALSLAACAASPAWAQSQPGAGEQAGKALIIDNTCTDASKIPEKWLREAKRKFRVWYGHTSHGSQITSGMKAMNRAPFGFSPSGKDGALSYQETGGDLGHKGGLEWMRKTRAQLEKRGNDRNMVMWSWCGGCSDNTREGMQAYLEAMSKLEKDYPGVIFVYMTGHLDGSGVKGNLNTRNEQIRAYCRTNNKVLFDFAAIESYDPDGRCYLDRRADDACRYDRSGDGRKNGNWAKEWLAKHPNNGIALPDRAAHTHPLNGALKGRAFWWMLARLAGWDGESGPGR